MIPADTFSLSLYPPFLKSHLEIAQVFLFLTIQYKIIVVTRRKYYEDYELPGSLSVMTTVTAFASFQSDVCLRF